MLRPCAYPPTSRRRVASHAHNVAPLADIEPGLPRVCGPLSRLKWAGSGGVDVESGVAITSRRKSNYVLVALGVALCGSGCVGAISAGL